MTCIVGLETKDGAVLGADSAAVGGSHIHEVENDKIFRVNGSSVGVGYTSSFRMGQILKRDLVYSPSQDKDAVDDFVETVIPQIRNIFDETGFMKRKSDKEKGGLFLVAVKGKILKVQEDFSVLRNSKGYNVVGSGFKQALGSLHTTKRSAEQVGDLLPKQRVEMALKAAANSGKGVCGPFTIRSFNYDVG